MSALLSLRNISKAFGPTVAVDQLSLSLYRHEVFGLLGPSGCGKTSTLRIILGLESPDSGSVEFEGKDITAKPAEERGFGMVFQNYALFTKLNVFDNVAFGPRAKGLNTVEVNARAQEALSLVRLTGFDERSVNELSAGQQQRVAIARVIAQQSPLMLFDEPLVNFETVLRRRTRWDLRELIKRIDATAIYVTHDQEEAFSLCDRLGIMSAGRILQTGLPRDVYKHPAHIKVAEFFGLNLIKSIFVGLVDHEIAHFKTLEGGHVLSVALSNAQRPAVGQSCVLAIGPAAVLPVKDETAGPNILKATVREVMFAGSSTTIKVDATGLKLASVLSPDAANTPGDECLIQLPGESLTVLP